MIINEQMRQGPTHMTGNIKEDVEVTFIDALDVTITNFDVEVIKSEIYKLV